MCTPPLDEELCIVRQYDLLGLGNGICRRGLTGKGHYNSERDQNEQRRKRQTGRGPVYGGSPIAQRDVSRPNTRRQL